MTAGRGPLSIRKMQVRRLHAAMSEPFEIASGAQTEVDNFIVALRLSDGTTGFGECAPALRDRWHHRDATGQKLLHVAPHLEGTSVKDVESFCRKAAKLCDGNTRALAALEMACFDAWTRRQRTPLWIYFGGAESRVFTDVTVSIVPPRQAGLAARRILRRGISTIKIKVGRNLDDDEARVRAVFKAASKARLFLDANQGYRPAQAVKLVERLKRAGIRLVLFEQPVAKDDWEGLAEVQRKTRVPVAADESAASVGDVRRLARKKTVSVINVKLMKFGVWNAWEAARIARKAGLGLMMGGMVESRLAMGCAAHFAGGFGGFDFIDLDTPFWFAKDPMRGPLRIGPGGLYDLSTVSSGIGVFPRRT